MSLFTLIAATVGPLSVKRQDSKRERLLSDVRFALDEHERTMARAERVLAELEALRRVE